LNERLTRRDWFLIAVCCGIAALSLFITFTWFTAAFPEASIEFRYDRASSLPRAKAILDAQRIDTRTMKQTAVFDGDETAKIFLERSLGLSRANAVMRREVRIWWWRHRWFRPLQEEEFEVDVAPTGEIVGFNDKIPENRPLPAIDAATAQRGAESFLARIGVKLPDLQLVAQSERRLPRRTQRIFTWDSQSIHPAGAPYRHAVTVDGDRVSKYEQRVRVPDHWKREYRDLRSKNELAGNVDVVFFIITIVAAVAVFIVRLLRGDVHLRLLLGLGIASVILVTGTSLNAFPVAVAGYDTTTSYPAFLARVIISALLQGVGVAMLLAVLVGSGEVLYRERLPQHLAIPRLWQRRALASKSVFLAFVIGYTLVAFFLAYQVAFYLIAEKFGAWAPAEVPYDEMLNTAFPWIAVLFAGFFPSLSEEFMSRAFSIPFFERVFRSRITAIVIAGLIWGFGHATYPNQPFYIRGLEVGFAGVLIGLLFFRFGLLPLLIWHYTVDAIYTALLLFRSGNTYYVVSAGMASLVFAIPMLISIVLYIRNRGFVPDGDLSNATMPTRPAPVRPPKEPVPIAYPPRIPVTGARLTACLAVVAFACLLAAVRPASVDDVADYRITSDRAKEIASPYRIATRTYSAPVEGFRSWDPIARQEDGGAPSGFDSIAAGYLIQHGLSMRALVEVMRTKIEAATWMIRSFTPMQKEETFTEVDPRAARVIGYHKYQEEKKPGARLEQPAALAIAQSSFRRFGVDVRAFEVKDALAFQQPDRRDWLFHFQELQPLVAESYRRISVRVAGNEVTQFTTTMKIPDEAYRQAAQVTLVNIVLVVLRILGGLIILALIIAGFVIAARKHHFPWRRPLRWTAILAIVPIAGALMRWELTLFEYSTSIRWDTFVTGQVVTAIRNVGVQIGVIFLALTGIEAVDPQALDWLRREGRARFGRAALIVAVTAIGLAFIRRIALLFLDQAFPFAASAGVVNVPRSVAMPLPSLLAIGEAAIRAIEASAAVALFVRAVRTMPGRRWLRDAVAIAAIFFVTLEPSVTLRHMPLMLVASASGAVLVWFVVRFVLGENLLAYPVAVVLAYLLGNATTLLQNHRPDLIANAVVEIAAVIFFAVWIANREEHA
jgi:membrane protease YdiL (CAAX protease family)